MSGKEIFLVIVNKLESRYSDIGGLATVKLKSRYTIIYANLLYNYKKDDLGIELKVDEFPIMVCSLPNGNYFLMSTLRMVSFFRGKRYELLYSEYLWHDTEYMTRALPFKDNSPKVLKYLSLNNSEFLYEIESGLLLDAAHNCILYNLR